MFKEKEELYSVYIPNESRLYYVPKPVMEYIRFLKKADPVLESGTLKPAISKSCGDCKYCVKSSLNGDILGCKKDLVCEDFTKVKGE